MSWFKKSWFNKNKDRTSATPPQSGQSNPDQMVRMMASAPDEQRMKMLGDRLAVFADQEEATREQGMKGMLVAALRLPDDDYQKIAASRFKALNGLDAGMQMMLMKSHAAVVKSLSIGQQQKEMKAMKQIISGLPEDKRGQAMSMMQNLGLMGGNA